MMIEWLLIALFFFFALGVSVVAIYPFRRYRVLWLTFPLVSCGFMAICYSHWGGFTAWHRYHQQQQAQQLAQKMLQSIKSPQELIDKLKLKLARSPKSAQGWYLLGRLYLAQQKYKLAAAAFAQAHYLEPNNEQYAINYGHTLWKLNHQRFTPHVIAIYNYLLRHNPDQPDALAMLAMHAFSHASYIKAIEYWQHLLRLVPEHSDEAIAIRKAIAKAQEQI